MINYDLLNLVEKVLGKGRKTSGNDYAFFSPFKNHYKPKLEVDFGINEKRRNLWHCWISDNKGRDIVSLFKKIGVSKQYFDELYKIIGTKKLYQYNMSSKKEQEKLILPKEFVKLCDYPAIDDVALKLQLTQAVNYLKRRSITREDILRYEIGYCASGQYSGRVIIPSYDENLNLNFFIGRSIFDEDTMKYKNPNIGKNLIGLESLINWNQPVTLVEGIFDAISARCNAIPLFGKTISNKLKEKLLLRRPKLITVALDSDARSESIKLASYLSSEGLNVALMDLNKKDVNEMGFDRFHSEKKNTKEIDMYDIIKYKVKHA
jgi:DNA primase